MFIRNPLTRQSVLRSSTSSLCWKIFLTDTGTFCKSRKWKKNDYDSQLLCCVLNFFSWKTYFHVRRKTSKKVCFDGFFLINDSTAWCSSAQLTSYFFRNKFFLSYAKFGPVLKNKSESYNASIVKSLTGIFLKWEACWYMKHYWDCL